VRYASAWFQRSFVPLLLVLIALIGTTVWLDHEAEAVASRPIVFQVERRPAGWRADEIAEGGITASNAQAEVDIDAADHPAILAARASATRGDTAEALAGLEAALASEGDDPVMLNELAVVALRANRPARALTALDRAIQSAPSYFRAHYNRGIALTRTKRPKDALTAYLRACELRPKHFNARYNLGALRLRLDRPKAAAEALTTAVTLAGGERRARAFAALGLAHARAGHHDDAARAYRQAVQYQPNAIAPRYNLALLLVDRGGDRAHASARRLIERIKALRPDFAPAWFLEARLASAAGDDTAALAA